MTFKTHIIFAESLALPPALYLYFHHALSLEHLALYGATVAIGSLLPDLDHSRSFISKRVPFIPYLLSLFTHHRGFTHSMQGIVFIGMFLTILVLAKYLPRFLAIGFFVGYVLHIVGDAMTLAGIKNFCCKKGLYLLPKFLRFKTGSKIERFYFFLFSAILLIELSLTHPQFFKYAKELTAHVTLQDIQETLAQGIVDIKRLFFHSINFLKKSL